MLSLFRASSRVFGKVSQEGVLGILLCLLSSIACLDEVEEVGKVSTNSNIGRLTSAPVDLVVDAVVVDGGMGQPLEGDGELAVGSSIGGQCLPLGLETRNVARSQASSECDGGRTSARDVKLQGVIKLEQLETVGAGINTVGDESTVLHDIVGSSEELEGESVVR